jgi:Holliday junction resolvase
MVNSRRKGAEAERELANRLKEYGFSARRGQQFCGANGDPDIVCTDLEGWHIECKMVEQLNIDKAIDQATADCGEKTPVVIHRKKRRPWLVTIYLEDWLKLVK